MNGIQVLHRFELVPVIELEPYTFHGGTLSFPDATGADDPPAGERYWRDSLARAGVTGVRNLRPGSWHAVVAELSDTATLARLLDAQIRAWGGPENLYDGGHAPALNGGLALRCETPELLIEPQCCADLAEAGNWAEAAAYRGTDWQMLWVGHPWLSVRFEDPLLVLSELHESETPTAAWAVDPAALHAEAATAQDVLAAFADRVRTALLSLGLTRDPDGTARRLAGL